MSLAKELQERGYVHQISGPSLEAIVEGGPRTIYHGIDPSADSAHVGNFVIWMLLKRLAKAGHKIVFLVGGGTGMIGDPKPDSERQLKDSPEVAHNVAKLKAQAKLFFTGNEIEFVDNLEWLGELKFIDFLRDIGKHFTVNELIKKDAIATRLAGDSGLSYTEFAYPLLQGFDYLQLFETRGCTVQVGGSDQWGNIVSGVELVRRKKQSEVFAITVPLIIDKSTGKKFGKSEGNAVWIDPEKTTPFQFYQFWFNVSDESVIEHLKRFTFLSLSQIDEVRNEFEVNPSARMAQRTLAFAVTEIVHGAETAQVVRNVSEILFGEGSLEQLTYVERQVLLQNAPTSEADSGVLLAAVLVEIGLATSRREARTFIEGGAVSVNGKRAESVELVLEKENTSNNLLIIRRGKKQLHVLVLK